MPFDGLFVHHLTKELTSIEHTKIYKIISITDNEYEFILSNKENLYICINPDCPHLRLTKNKFLSSSTNLTLFLKKHIEGAIINSIKQYNNDRIIKIDLTCFNDLGYEINNSIIIELMGKYTNLIILDKVSHDYL